MTAASNESSADHDRGPRATLRAAGEIIPVIAGVATIIYVVVQLL